MAKPASMPHSRKSAFAIVRFNAQTHDRGVVIAVLSGRANAEARLAELRKFQASSDWLAGWRYFLELTDLEPGIDPQEATRARQELFERRESEYR